jgi:hypothetical protein
MAGDWIKMRSDLFTHPKVVRISSALKADRLRTVGGLMSVWCLFDVHSEDGCLSGYTPESLDDLVGWPGFAAAMQAVEWLETNAAGDLCLPRFASHNGQSAKRRAQDAERKSAVRKVSASDADKTRTREEKRREEKEEEISGGVKPSSEPQSFQDFWSTWPKSGRKGGKAECLKVWQSGKLEAQAPAILAHVKTMAASREWTKDNGDYIPAPVVYLRGKRWDGAEVDAAGSSVGAFV